MAGVKAAVPRVSYADMERWPEDGRRYELYDGEVFEIPSHERCGCWRAIASESTGLSIRMPPPSISTH